MGPNNAPATRSAAAVAAAVQVARSYGIVVCSPTVLNDFFSVVVHLAPAPVVARIPTAVRTFRADDLNWMTRELALTTHLRALGAPVVGPSTELPPGPHRRDGFTVSFWTHVVPDPRRPSRQRTAWRCCHSSTAPQRTGHLPRCGAAAGLRPFLTQLAG